MSRTIINVSQSSGKLIRTSGVGTGEGFGLVEWRWTHRLCYVALYGRPEADEIIFSAFGLRSTGGRADLWRG